MKVCTYSRQTPLGRIKRLGIFFNETSIIDVNLVWRKYYELEGYFHAEEKANSTAPTKLSEFLKTYQESSIEMLQETLETFKEFAADGILKTDNEADLAFDLKDAKDARLECPLDRIHVYRDFYAHEKHVAKGFEKRGEPIPEAWYEIPAYYKGSTAGFIGPEEIIPWPSYTNKLDYELEFGVVIGRDGKNIKAENALEHVFGYTVFNDISARDIQKKEMAVRLGPAKGKDFCSIMGPVIITADEFMGKEPSLKMTATVNGELWSEGLTSDSHYTWAQMIEHASREEWLLATDFMGSGTVGTGCGLELDKWIQPGDVLELEIEKIGKLKNIVGTPNQENA
tara:strand:+ start:868 stop:1887 length:1020 start_codon:yes stop_codon:yes gene_type:complete